MIRTLKFLNIFLAILIFPISSLIVKDYLVYRYSSYKKTEAKSSAPLYTPIQKNLQGYAPIVESSIFPASHNRLTPIGSIKDVAAEAIDITPPLLDNLLLRGTITGKRSYAIFETREDKKEGIFKIGESVFEAGILKNVHKDKALLLSGSRKMSFDIADEEKIHVLPSQNRPSRLSVPAQQTGQKYADLSPLSKKIGENEWVIDQRAVFKALEDMSQVLTDARLTPNMAEGKVEGFRITEIKPRGIFDAIGLKNGDILIRVNNYDIDSPEKAIQVISGLKGEAVVRLDLMRDGQKVSFNYQIK